MGVYSHSIPFAHGGGEDGKIIGVTWDSILFKRLTAAADVFWPAMDNPDVVEYLQDKAWMKGLQPEDIIIEIEGKQVTSIEVVRETINERNVGDEVSLKIWRAGEIIEMEIALLDQNDF